MATIFGDNLKSTGQPIGNVGFNHARLRRTSTRYPVGGLVSSIGDVFPVAVLKSSDRVHHIAMARTASTLGSASVGVWNASFSGGVFSLGPVVNDSLFRTSVAITAAALAPGTTMIASLPVGLLGLPLWQQLGLTSDPGLSYVIGMSVTAAITGTAEAFFTVDYVAGD